MGNMMVMRLLVSDLVGDQAAADYLEAIRLLNIVYQSSEAANSPTVAEYLIKYINASDPSQKVLVFPYHREVLGVLEAVIYHSLPGVEHV